MQGTWLIAVHLCVGLLLSSIRDPDPVVFFEAKMQYRTVSEEVPTGDYMIPLRQARIASSGSDITLVGWGQQVAVLERAVGSSVHYRAIQAALQPSPSLCPHVFLLESCSVR